MNTIPLFPLSSVLFLKGRMPLQIFEQRYIELVSQCMKTDTGFGIVWLQQGSEVTRLGQKEMRFGEYGTYARIVDWDLLPNGLLGIKIEGQEVFKIFETQLQDSKLVTAEVDYLPILKPLMNEEFHQHFLDVLDALERHPHASELGLNYDKGNTLEVAGVLTQLLPIQEIAKYEVFCIDEPGERLKRVDQILSELSGEIA
tara:strand:- start:347 stop:946 length:600 start_codon:yes stop_codon:yes gene_type:complete